MSERPFNVADWLTECPPDHETVVGWLARNSPAVLEDLVERFPEPMALSAVLAPEHLAVSRAVRRKDGVGAVAVVRACPAYVKIGWHRQYAWPVGLLNEVLSKDIYQTP